MKGNGVILILYNGAFRLASAMEKSFITGGWGGGVSGKYGVVDVLLMILMKGVIFTVVILFHTSHLTFIINVPKNAFLNIEEGMEEGRRQFTPPSDVRVELKGLLMKNGWMSEHKVLPFQRWGGHKFQQTLKGVECYTI